MYLVMRKNNHFLFTSLKKKMNHLNLLLITEDEKNHYSNSNRIFI